MTSRNLRILSVSIFLCLACAIQAKRYRDVNDIALALDLVEQLYVKPVERSELSRKALGGMMAGLDNYSSYIPPENVEEFQSAIDQSFAGLGVVITKSASQPLRVVRTIHNSPAQKAGLMVGDLIIEVDGESTEDMTTETATSKLRGAPNTSVRLTIESANQEKKEISVKRDIIETPSLIGDYRNGDGKPVFRMQADSRIAYTHMSVFGAQSNKEMETFLRDEAANAKAVVWDLRDNAGGLLDAARDLCDLFIDDEVICSIKGRIPEVSDVIKGKSGVLLQKDVPVVILLDEGSASASEVSAACLQDLKRAHVAGERSFGKGSVQNVIDMDGGRSRLRLTTAYWFPPSGRMVNRDRNDKNQTTWGVDPDPELKVELNDQQRQRVFTRMFLRDAGDLTAENLDLLGNSRQTEAQLAEEEKQTFDLSTLGNQSTIEAI